MFIANAESRELSFIYKFAWKLLYSVSYSFLSVLVL